MRQFMACLVAVLLSAGEEHPQMRTIALRVEAEVSAAEKVFFAAKAKALEAAAADLAKLRQSEARKGTKADDVLLADLDRRLESYRTEAAQLRDYPMMRAKAIERALRDGSFTARDWERIEADVVSWIPGQAAVPTRVRNQSGGIYFAIPHPEDTWSGWAEGPSGDWRGLAEDTPKLRMQVDDNVIDGLFVTDAGSIYFGPNCPMPEAAVGRMRIKLVRIH